MGQDAESRCEERDREARNGFGIEGKKVIVSYFLYESVDLN